MGTRNLTTPLFRASYVSLLKPKQNKNGAWAFELSMIFEPEGINTPEFQEMKKLEQEAIADFYPSGPPKTGVASPFRKGVWKSAEYPQGYDLDKYPEYEGKCIVTARSYTSVVGTDSNGNLKFDLSQKPGLCGPDPRAIFDPHGNPADKIYSGMFARAEINMYVSTKGEIPRVCVGLNNVQKCADGDPLGRTNNPPERAFDVFEQPKAEGNHAELLAGI